MKIVIRGGRVYDPANGVDGEVRDVFVDGGSVVAPFPTESADRVLDAGGHVVMPGGVDLHSHIAGPSAQRARRLLAGAQETSPPLVRSRGRAPTSVVPTPEATARLYASIGYTFVVDAAISPTASRCCWHDLEASSGIDTAFLLLVANNEMLLDALDRGETELAREVVAHLLSRTGAFGLKAVNAGGVAHWRDRGTTLDGIHDGIGGRSLRPRDILEFLAETAHDLGLTHPLHVHVAKLGTPGNIDVTIETSKALGGRAHHIAHAAFNVYGATDSGGFASAATRFSEHLERHAETTADVGQLWFGDTVTVSADQEIQHRLWEMTRRPYVTLDLECEDGAAIVPIEYRPSSRLHVLQWAVGMELLLTSPDPWRLVFSTDHPNGAPFLSYPTLLAQLMNRDLRLQVLAQVGEDALPGSVLRELTREYTLGEIAIITRAGPARILGLDRKGQLGVGADADVTVYTSRADREAMFRSPRWVVRGGELVVDEGEWTSATGGITHRVAPQSDPRGAAHLRHWFARDGSYSVEQLGPRPSQLDRSRVASSGSGR